MADFNAPRLYLDALLTAGAPVPLDRAQANYLFNVLRLRSGGDVLIFNTRDGEWLAVVEGEGKRATLAVAERTRPPQEPADLHYLFAPLKAARLDYMVQKAVEMGAGLLRPVLTQHTHVSRVNLDRMRANAIEAAEQCGIIALPTVEPELSFPKAMGALEPERLLVFCDEDAPVRDPVAALRSVPEPTAKIAVVVGPEGGFTQEERALALRHPRTVRLSLGPRILRADTAAVAALALVQAVLGDAR